MSINQIKTCRFVRRCIDGNVCSNFIDYVVKRDHNIATQNNSYQLEQTDIQLEYSLREYFYYIWGKLYNDLLLQKNVKLIIIILWQPFDGQYLTLYIHVIFYQSFLNFCVHICV